MTCPTPLTLGTLADYWQAELPASHQDRVEEHIMSCADCAAALEFVARVARGAHETARAANLPVVLSAEFLAAFERQGYRVRQYSPANGGSVQCTVTKHDDLLVGRLRVDLRGVTRLDAILRGADGAQWARLNDIPFRAAPDAEIIFNQPLDTAKASGPDTMVVELIDVEGAREIVRGRYTFNHYPTLEEAASARPVKQ